MSQCRGVSRFLGQIDEIAPDVVHVELIRIHPGQENGNHANGEVGICNRVAEKDRFAIQRLQSRRRLALVAIHRPGVASRALSDYEDMHFLSVDAGRAKTLLRNCTTAHCRPCIGQWPTHEECRPDRRIGGKPIDECHGALRRNGSQRQDRAQKDPADARVPACEIVGGTAPRLPAPDR